MGLGEYASDQLVADGRMHKPKRVDGCVVWDRYQVDAAITDLPDQVVNPLDRMFRFASELGAGSIVITAVVTALLSAAAAFIGSWLAARFALDRFRHEKIWERRAAAYTSIFELLHDYREWFIAHQFDLTNDLSDEEKGKVSIKYRDATASLKRRLESETWLVSDQFRKRLERLEEDLSRRYSDWPEYLELGRAALESAIDDLRRIAREELGVPAETLR